MWGWLSLLQLKYEGMKTLGSPRAQRNFPLSLISNCEAVAGIEADRWGTEETGCANTGIPENCSLGFTNAVTRAVQ